MNFNNAKCSRIIRAIVVSTMPVHGCLWIFLLEPKRKQDKDTALQEHAAFVMQKPTASGHSRAERRHLNSFVFSRNEILGLLESSSRFNVVSVSEAGSRTHKSRKHLGAAMFVAGRSCQRC